MSKETYIDHEEGVNALIDDFIKAIEKHDLSINSTFMAIEYVNRYCLRGTNLAFIDGMSLDSSNK